MLTVLLATRNRASILRDALEAYCQLEAPPLGWKLVVVDNGSTDQTPEVLASFRGRLPLHYVSEPTLGKNHALNAGLGLAEGDLIVFTDDDAFPRADWLKQLRKAADSQSEYSIFGGAVVPRWEISPPVWIEWAHLSPTFTITDPSQPEGPITSSLVYGPNMAIRASIFGSGIRFDPAIGPRGSDYPMGSETELLLRLELQGHKAWRVRGAVVEHFVRQGQLNKAWVFKRAIRFGRGLQRLGHKQLFPDPKLWGDVPRHLFRDFPREVFLMAAAWVFCRRDAVFRARWRLNILWGKAIEARIIGREKRAQAMLGAERLTQPEGVKSPDSSRHSQRTLPR